jgi:hypothetical protein
MCIDPLLTKSAIVDQIERSIERLEAWIENNGWAGYDPYDIKGTKVFLYLTRKASLSDSFLKYPYRVLTSMEKHFPSSMRKLFSVKKQINAKAMGLFAKSYLSLLEITGKVRFKHKADLCLEWLQQNQAHGYSGSCWGYPFDWQSMVFFPKGTPSSVVSSIVGDAYWSAYRLFGQKTYLKTCESICEFFVNDLNIDQIDDERICFSYTPIDDFHVHNANLFVAELLTKVGTEINRKDFCELGSRAANYSLSEQNPDGSFYYWGKIQNYYNPNHIDHYHSGFEIRMLHNLWKITNSTRIKEAFDRYALYYLENLYTSRDETVLPKMSPFSLYPVDIHACAESLLCLSTLAEYFETARLYLPKVYLWLIANLQTDQGCFRYKILKKRFGKYPINISYIRWGQAWMMVALAACFRFYNQHKLCEN